MRNTFFTACAATMLFACPVAMAQTQIYSCGFDSPPYTVGTINLQESWTTAQATAIVAVPEMSIVSSGGPGAQAGNGFFSSVSGINATTSGRFAFRLLITRQLVQTVQLLMRSGRHKPAVQVASSSRRGSLRPPQQSLASQTYPLATVWFFMLLTQPELTPVSRRAAASKFEPTTAKSSWCSGSTLANSA